MKLPTTISINRRKVAVCPASGPSQQSGAGSGEWNEGRMTLYYDERTSNRNILTTMIHEAIEIYLQTRGKRFENDAGLVLLIMEHPPKNPTGDVDAICDLIAKIIEQLAKTNGWAYKPGAAWSKSTANAPIL